jgi:hypothetical protein
MNLRIHALKKASRQRPGVKIAAARFFFNFILSILRKKVKLLPAKCTAPGKFFCE